MLIEQERQHQVEHEYRPYGSLVKFARELFSLDTLTEHLVEGPAGTGKSRGILEMCYAILEEYPNTRMLLGRKTMTSMRDTILVTLEKEVIPPGHPSLGQTGSRRTQQRPIYHFPNGSEIICCGFDDPEKIKSSQYDIVYVNEGTELTEDDWQIALSRLRNRAIPLPLEVERKKRTEDDAYAPTFRVAIIDCNPDSPYHWLNRRGDEPFMKRWRTRHEDNPTVDNQYLNTLRSLTGVRRKRLYEGLWCAAEGLIWEDFDPEKHIVERSRVFDVVGGEEELKPEFKHCFGSLDFGWRNPGVAQIWAANGDQEIFRIHEVYRAEMKKDWWIERCVWLQSNYDLSYWVADPSEPDTIDALKARGLFVREANNDIFLGLNAVRDRLKRPQDDLMPPTLYLVRDALEERDPKLVERKHPLCTEQEIPAYIYLQYEEGKPIKEKPDPACADHGCDAMRYAVMSCENRTLVPKEKKPKYDHGTFGRVLNHRAKWEAIENGRQPNMPPSAARKWFD